MRLSKKSYLLPLIGGFFTVSTALAVSTNTISKVEQSVVRVFPLSADGEKILGSGTGFVIGDGKHLVTNAHVVEGTSRISIIGKGNDSKPFVEAAQIIWVSKDMDIAVLSISERRLSPLSIYSPNINKGETVFALGYPGAADQAFAGSRTPSTIVEATLTRGEMGRRFTGKWIKSGPEVGILQHSAHINSGNSGGPLFDACGRVVGINTAKALSTVEKDGAVNASNGIYFSSDARTLLSALNTARIDVTTDTSPCSEGRGDLSGTSSPKGGLTDKWFKLLLSAVLLLALSFASVRIYRYRRSASANPTNERGSDKPEGASKSSDVNNLLLKVSTPSARDSIFNLGFILEKKGYAVVGRDRGGACDLVVDDENVSRQHLRFDFRGGALFVTDLRSSNGTTVSGVKIGDSPHSLRHGDEVGLGKSRLSLTWIR